MFLVVLSDSHLFKIQNLNFVVNISLTVVISAVITSAFRTVNCFQYYNKFRVA